MSSTVASRLRQVREETGLTTEKFANKARLSVSNVWKIEHGKSPMTRREATIICNVYGISKKWLETGVGIQYAETTVMQPVLLTIKELRKEVREKIIPGREYKIMVVENATSKERGSAKSRKIVKPIKVRCIKIYPHNVLFERRDGIKMSFSYIDAYEYVLCGLGMEKKLTGGAK